MDAPKKKNNNVPSQSRERRKERAARTRGPTESCPAIVAVVAADWIRIAEVIVDREVGDLDEFARVGH